MLLKEKILTVAMIALLGLSGCGDRPVGKKSATHVDVDGDGYSPDLPVEDPNYDPDDTDPCIPNLEASTCEEDTDGDGIINPDDPDYLDPCNPNIEAGVCDQDEDGLTNDEEADLGTNPKVADTDGDGLYDGEEVNNIDDNNTVPVPENTTDPLDSCDPMQNPGYSYYDNNNTMWQVKDCDGDGYDNGAEDNITMVDFGQPLSDPYDPLSACFVFNDYKYCEAHVADGNIWFDRNLKADRVCESATDSQCYGALYQWGRGKDGHELRDSTTMEGPVGVLEYDGSNEKFVTMDEESEDAPNDWGDNDDDGEIREAAWHDNDHDLLSICPKGWYVPTIDELKQAFLDDNITGLENAMSGVLKLGSAGKRNSLGNKEEDGTAIFYWSSSPFGKSADSRFINTGVGTKAEDRSVGYSIRCIKK